MLKYTLTAVLFLVCGISVLAQENEAPSRSITAEGFSARRPAAAKAAAGSNEKRASDAAGGSNKSSAVLTGPRRKYSFVSRVTAVKPTAGSARGGAPPARPIAPVAKPNREAPKLLTEELGVTFWRLRPLADSDGDVPTFPVKVGDGTQKWAAERVRSSTQFKPGDRVRFTIEASRSGYLYIANREVYADGSTGDAEIIFPTLRTRSGDNHVSAGTLIEVPGASDSVPYFTIQRRRADYVGEELIVVITPNEMTDVEKSLRPQPISHERLDKWYQWQMGEDIYDADDGEGLAFTRTEADVAESNSRSLTREEPLPQTLYKVTIAKETPLFVIIRMQAAK